MVTVSKVCVDMLTITGQDRVTMAVQYTARHVTLLTIRSTEVILTLNII